MALGGRVKERLLPKLDFYLDMTTEGSPAMVSGEGYRAALEEVVTRSVSDGALL